MGSRFHPAKLTDQAHLPVGRVEEITVIWQVSAQRIQLVVQRVIGKAEVCPLRGECRPYRPTPQALNSCPDARWLELLIDTRVEAAHYVQELTHLLVSCQQERQLALPFQTTTCCWLCHIPTWRC